jgi:BON domain
MMFKKNHKTTFSIILISSICFSCSGNSESNTAKNNNGNQTIAVTNSNAALPTTPAAAVNNNLPAASSNQAANANKGFKPAPAANQPTPKIGSGAGDLALFTQVRGAFSSDPELLNGVIIDIKEGNAALSGRVPSQEKKKKAEQLVQNITGIKSVKNNISVSP